MTPPARITAAMLLKHGACAPNVRYFRKLFPKGADVTVANALRCVRAGLSLGWAASRLLSAPALAAYHEASAQELAAYRQATAPAFVKAWDKGKGARP
jgi:hypothetical protein